MIAVLVCRMLRVTHEPEQPIAVIIRASDFGYFLLPACTVDREPHQLAHRDFRSEEHTSELQSLMRISYADFCLKKKKHRIALHQTKHHIRPVNPATTTVTVTH